MFRNGKNPKWPYFAKSVAALMVPSAFYRMDRERILRGWEDRADADEIRDRVEYYCRLRVRRPLDASSPRVGDRIRIGAFTYKFDMRGVLRYFPAGLRYVMVPGDVTAVPRQPSFVKSRPICNAPGEEPDNANSVLTKLNRVRHFIFASDDVPFERKADRAVFRGKVWDNKLRRRCFEKYLGNPRFDLGDTAVKSNNPDEWYKPKMTIAEQLRSKFVLSLEGNDVASNLKWIMSSNSVAISTKPRFETWFMEGRLEGGVHYVEVADDLSDLDEKVRYYAEHIDESKRMIENAHRWVDRFRDPRREKIIELLTAQRYFDMTTAPDA